jgi:hypothetical protein
MFNDSWLELGIWGIAYIASILLVVSRKEPPVSRHWAATYVVGAIPYILAGLQAFRRNPDGSFDLWNSVISLLALFVLTWGLIHTTLCQWRQ